MSDNKTNIKEYLFLLFIVAILGYSYYFLITGAFYSMPNAEDFSITALVKKRGVFGAIEELLISYDGRYFTNFLHGINPLAYNWINGYRWQSLFSLFFPVFSLSFFLKSIWSSASNIKLFLIATTFFAVNYALSPSLPHLVYWMISSYVYLYSWCFWLIWIGAFVRMIKSKNKLIEVCCFFITVLSLFFSTGTNEMMVFVNVFSLLCIYYFVKHFHPSKFSLLIPILITGLFSIIFFLSSPGILKRVFLYAPEHQSNHLSSLIFKSISDFMQEFFRWHTSGLLLLLAAFLLFVVLLKKPLDIPLKYKRFFLLSLLLSFPILYFMTFTYYLPMGHESSLPQRIYSFVFLGYQIWLVGLFIYLSSFKNTISDYFKTTNLLNIKLSLSILMLFSIHFSVNNFQYIKVDLESGVLKEFYTQMQKRLDLLNELKIQHKSCRKVIELPLIESYPESIHLPTDIVPNKSIINWNIAYQKYFDIDEVRLEGDTFFTVHQFYLLHE